jgi:heme A synthase
MTSILFHAHSGVRFLVLLAALVALVVLASGWAQRRPWSKAARISLAAFTGLLDLQIVLGIVLAGSGVFYPALMGHITLMVLAAVFAHGLSVAARRSVDERRRYALALGGVVLALALVVAGIGAIGRGPFGTSGRPSGPTQQQAPQPTVDGRG